MKTYVTFSSEIRLEDLMGTKASSPTHEEQSEIIRRTQSEDVFIQPKYVF